MTVGLLIQSAVLAIGWCAVGALVLGLWWWGTWSWDGSWVEATRHPSLRMALDRWIWLRWIHPDCEYWLAHVDFRQGAVVVRGPVPDGLYWSLTWYVGTQTHDSLSDQTVLVEDGQFEVRVGGERSGTDNWIEVPEGTGRAVLYLRVYEPPEPVVLPQLHQAGRLLDAGGVKP